MMVRAMERTEYIQCAAPVAQASGKRHGREGIRTRETIEGLTGEPTGASSNRCHETDAVYDSQARPTRAPVATRESPRRPGWSRVGARGSSPAEKASAGSERPK
jgi:hypothetical protein